MATATGWHTHCARVFQTLPPFQTLSDPGRSLRVITLQEGPHRVGDEQGCIGLSLLLLLTREELTADPVPLKPRSGPGVVMIWGSPSLLCQRWRWKGGSQLAPVPVPTPEGFLPAARSPGTMAQPGRHGHTPAEEQTGCYSSAEAGSPVGPVRLSPLLLGSPPRDDGDEEGICTPAQPRGPRQFPPCSETAPLPFAAVIKSVEKEHLGPLAPRAKMRLSVWT